MRLSFHPGVSQLTLLSLAFLFPFPWTITSYPYSPAALLPTLDGPELQSALLQLQAALEDLRDNGHPEVWAVWPQDPQPALPEPRMEELLRGQRGDLVARLLSPFPGRYSPESMHYQEGGEGEDGGRKNETLTSIAGGLQAVNREKGGFGFRFGRKRWTDRGWRDERRRRTEEDKWN